MTCWQSDGVLRLSAWDPSVFLGASTSGSGRLGWHVAAEELALRAGSSLLWPSHRCAVRLPVSEPPLSHTVAGIIGGNEYHTDVVAALDSLGRVLGTASFPATPTGYTHPSAWLHAFGPVLTVGVDSTGSFGAALTRALTAQRLCVIEVNRPRWVAMITRSL